MPFELRSLSSSTLTAIPYKQAEDSVQIGDRGYPHFIKMFPAIVREANVQTPQKGVLGDAGATCFYHKDTPATAICEISGRMICDLCKTEWEGKIVSIQSLQEMLSSEKKPANGAFRWDRLMAYLLFVPVVFIFTIFLTIVTAPITALMGLVLLVRPPRASPVPVARGRYAMYSVLSLIVCAFWVLFVLEWVG
ncbi:MAG: hypothetical protein AAF212_10285 [Verrucomicrobiota bacterium]